MQPLGNSLVGELAAEARDAAADISKLLFGSDISSPDDVFQVRRWSPLPFVAEGVPDGLALDSQG